LDWRVINQPFPSLKTQAKPVCRRKIDRRATKGARGGMDRPLDGVATVARAQRASEKTLSGTGGRDMKGESRRKGDQREE